MKLTKQALVELVKEELAELDAFLADGLERGSFEENIVAENIGYHPSWEAALGYDPYDLPRKDWADQMEERHESMLAPWTDALAAADTGWGPGSLEESIQSKLETLLKK